VWLCEWRETHIVAVKKLRPEWLELEPEVAWDDFETEVKFLRTIRHPNITLFYGAGQLVDGTPFLVVEYLTRGSVRKKIRATNLEYSI
jgi:serine/threonine protein kinase